MTGSIIKLKRLDKNYTQEYMAEVLDIDKSTYSRIENNQIKPKKEYLEKLALEFQCSLEDFNSYSQESISMQSVLNSSSQQNDKDLIPVEFVEKMLDRMERMHEYMASVIKEIINKKP